MTCVCVGRSGRERFSVLALRDGLERVLAVLMPTSVTARQACRTAGGGLVGIAAVGSIGLAAAKVTWANRMGAPESLNGWRRVSAQRWARGLHRRKTGGLPPMP